MHRIICHLWLFGSAIFSHIILWTARFSGERGVVEYKNVCFDFLYNFCLKHIILRRTERDMIKNVNGLHVNYPLFLSVIKETWTFSTDFLKSTQISNFMKIRPVGAEFFHADLRTDKTMLIVDFQPTWRTFFHFFQCIYFSTSTCVDTIVPSWWWALVAWNM
jgi:hypothetical protein